MTEQKLTEWFPDSVEPVRDGVYEVQFPTSKQRLFSRWHKGFWHRNSEIKSEAAKAKEQSYFAKALRGQMEWRGIAK